MIDRTITVAKMLPLRPRARRRRMREKSNLLLDLPNIDIHGAPAFCDEQSYICMLLLFATEFAC